jgi:PPM family protein phosphatase
MKVAAVSDIGLHRKRNEDHYLVDEDRKVFMVCDGMGGHRGGDVASQLAVETVQKCLVFTRQEEIIPALLAAINRANQVICEKGCTEKDLYEMGTTLTAAVVMEDKMTVAHVGDSSLFLYSNGRLTKVTNDHTLAERMLQEGMIKKEALKTNQYNHILTRAVGVDPQVEIDIHQVEIKPGDWILLCSDGLTDLVTEEEIALHLSAAQNPQGAVRTLVDLALAQGGHDNITIVLISI